MDLERKKRRARRRALRAAQVVTIAFALGTGCSSKAGPPDALAMDSAVMDSAVAMDSAVEMDSAVDSATDSAVAEDAMADATMGEDAAMDAAVDMGRDAIVDAGFDAGEDAAVADVGVDAFECAFPPTTEECCEICAGGAFCSWDPDSAMCLVAVPGPFVPPSMIA